MDSIPTALSTLAPAAAGQGWLIWTLGALALGLMAVLTRQGWPLRCHRVPLGIVSFELAWSAPRAQEIMDAWRAGCERPDAGDLTGRARRQLLLDFAFIAVYPLFLAGLVSMLVPTTTGPFAQIGASLSWAVLLADPLDVIENLLLLRLLRAEAAAPLPVRVAAVAAWVKFALVIAALGWAVLVWLGGR